MANICSSIRIGIDGFNLALPKGTGVATYARALSYCLRDEGYHVDVLYGMNIRRDMSVALREVMFFENLGHLKEPPGRRRFSPKKIKDLVTSSLDKSAIAVPISGKVESRGLEARLPAYDRLLNVPYLFHEAHMKYRNFRRFTKVKVAHPPKIMHWTYPLPIYMEGAINIYTIHDIVPLKLPYTTLDNKIHHERLIRDLCRKADGICTVSENSQKDIIEFCPEAEGKIYNTYQSSALNSKELKAETEVARELQSVFGLEVDSYFLFYGSLEPKKNIGRIIEAFLEADTKRRLVLIGAMAWRSEQELRFLDHGIAINRIMKIDYLPESLLISCIRGARAVVFPSISEGFGLPVLEAMALGTATITSQEGSLREVVGDNAALVDPYSVTDIKEAIEKVDRDDDFCRYLEKKGPEQAKKFDMASYAQRLKNMYEDVLRKKG